MTDKSVVPCKACKGSGYNPTPLKWPGQDCNGCDGTGDESVRVAYQAGLIAAGNPLSLETSDLDPITPEEDALATAILAAVGRTRQSHDTVVRAIRDGLAKAAAVIVPGWQPIETAPRDGTPFLIWADGYEWPEVIRWEDYDEECRLETGEDGYFAYAESLMADACDPIDMADFMAWMPLPSARSAHSIQSGGEGGES